ncbi:MAG: hypothetical protein IPO94_10830 [Saprospiraceae bacterium]|nr:hypothetical protein [Saprospiraceae bacterium]
MIPYCNINNGGRESIWDIDDIKVLGGCCAGNTEQMTYAWSNGQTGSSIMVTPSTTTSYSVTVTDCLWLFKCCAAYGACFYNQG